MADTKEEKKTINLQFDTDAIDLLLRGLGELPTKQSIGLYTQLANIRVKMDSDDGPEWEAPTPEDTQEESEE